MPALVPSPPSAGHEAAALEQPSSPPSAARSLHPLTGTPPRRNGTNKALPLSPLNRRLTSVSTSGVPGLPTPPSSPRSGGSSPKGGAGVQLNEDQLEEKDLQEIRRLEQRLHELDVHEKTLQRVAERASDDRFRSAGTAIGMMTLPDDVLERIVLAAERSLPQLSATCRRFRALVTSKEFDAVWLGQCATLLGNSSQNFRALHGCGAARSADRTEQPVWRMIAIELRSGRVGGGGQTFAVHPAALCFNEPEEESHYFGLLSRILVDSPESSDGSEVWHKWKHVPLRWQAGDQCRALVEEFHGPDQSISLELATGPCTAAGQQPPLKAGDAKSLGAGTKSMDVRSAALSWCSPVEVIETRVLYRVKFPVSQKRSNEGAVQWEMSISYTPKTSLYVLH
jgi:hypothetical protein